MHSSLMRFGPAIRERRLLKSAEVMVAFGYHNRAAFWEFVKRSGVPHIRFNARRIMFDELALAEWIAKRSSA